MRRGQLFSMDALISLVLVIMVLGTVSATSENLRDEIASMIGWYERANIADSMLDVLTKSPGEPEDWESNPSSVMIVGLRSPKYPHALDYNKVKALVDYFSTSTAIQNALYDLGHMKDFQMELYLTQMDVSINGSFAAEIYADLTGDFENIKIALAADNSGNRAFRVKCDSVKVNGAPSPYGMHLTLFPGDVLEFITIDPAQVLIGGNDRVDVIPDNDNPEDPIPRGSYVQILVFDARSNYHYSLIENNGVCELHIGGHGQVKLLIQGNSGADFGVIYNVTFPRFSSLPTSSIILINGTVANETIARASRLRSPWIEYVERGLVVTIKFYNSTLTVPDRKERIIAGKLTQNVPALGFLEFTTTGNGNATFVIIDGNVSKGLIVWRGRSSGILKASITWHKGDEVRAFFYKGNTTSVTIPLNVMFNTFDPGKGPKVVEVWSVKNNFDAPLVMTDGGTLGPILAPKFEPLLIKLWVWDDS